MPSGATADGLVPAGNSVAWRQRGKPVFGPRRPLCAGRRQRRRRGGARRGGAAVRASSTTARAARRSGGGARRPQGPADEGRAAARDHPRGAAGRIRRELSQLQSAGAADGTGVRAAAHAGRAGAGLGSALHRVSSTQPAASASLGQVHRAVGARRPRAGGQAAVSRHAVGRRGGPHPAQGRLRHPRAHEPGGRDRRDPEGDFGAAARGARLRAGGAPHGASTRSIFADERASACRTCCPSCRPSAC